MVIVIEVQARVNTPREQRTGLNLSECRGRGVERRKVYARARRGPIALENNPKMVHPDRGDEEIAARQVIAIPSDSCRVLAGIV